ncbi:MAG: isoprenyl transferase [Candidatus Omnitrophica bacterium]|nr:isoprenyl transferase [Candidatus Omnitrophota bacterium]MBU1869863.1 isoprenyl transferase [Candidatus Omnitrophota bacterium]
MIDKNRLPKHIAFIMDGNGRWAKERGLMRTLGHREGVERVREIVSAAAEIGMGTVTFFAFSSENWNRPKREIDALMRYLDSFLEREVKKLNKKNIRFKVVGQNEPLPKNIQEKIISAQALTKKNTGLTVVLALNYGSRQEIVDAAKQFALDAQKGKIKIDSLRPEDFGRYLYTAGIPDPDLLIRTSGEMRISNFLLWQLSYAELYFAKKYWPDFKRKDLEEAIREYQRRERRFGDVDAKE